jgi:hypothetical protein
MVAESATYNNWEVPPGYDDDNDGDSVEDLATRWCLSPNTTEDIDTTELDPRACT